MERGASVSGAAAAGSGRAALAAAGTVRGCDPDRIILKKITLTGEGVKNAEKIALNIDRLVWL